MRQGLQHWIIETVAQWIDPGNDFICHLWDFWKKHHRLKRDIPGRIWDMLVHIWGFPYLLYLQKQPVTCESFSDRESFYRSRNLSKGFKGQGQKRVCGTLRHTTPWNTFIKILSIPHNILIQNHTTLRIRFPPQRPGHYFEDLNTPASYRFIHPSIGGSLVILRAYKIIQTNLKVQISPMDLPTKRFVLQTFFFVSNCRCLVPRHLTIGYTKSHKLTISFQSEYLFPMHSNGSSRFMFRFCFFKKGVVDEVFIPGFFCTEILGWLKLQIPLEVWPPQTGMSCWYLVNGWTNPFVSINRL